MQVVHAFKIFAAVDGHCHGVQLNLQFVLNFFQQVKAVLAIPVHFIDKHNYRRIAHGNHFHQPPGLCLYAIHAVYHQHHTVHRR